MNDFIEELESIKDPDINRVGGKAFHLIKLIEKGFPVPTGFCIAVGAYSQFLQFQNTKKKIQLEMGHLDWQNLSNLKKCSSSIANLIQQQNFPQELENDILSAWAKFKNHESWKAVVRSSATAEDRWDLSFAGQYRSVLNISEQTELLAAIKKIWASVWNERALAYCSKNNINPFSIQMAILIQKFINTSVSGVLFTANPITNSSDEIMIQSTWGLAENLVSGKTMADEFIVKKDDKKIISCKIIPKTKIMTAQGEDIITEEVSEDKAKKETLSAEQVVQLANYGEQIEGIFGGPQDIEWGIYQDDFFIFQTRPITTLIPIKWANQKTRQLFEGQVVYWSNFNTRETLPYPLTPFSASYFMDLIFPRANKKCLGLTEKSIFYAYGIGLDLIYNRLYWNMNMLFGTPFSKHLRLIDVEAATFFEKLLQREKLFIPKPKAFALKFLLFLFLFSLIFRIFLTLPWFKGEQAMKKGNQRLWQKGLEFENLDLRNKSSYQLIQSFKDYNIFMADVGFIMLLFTVINGITGISLLQRFTKKWQDISYTTLLSGVPGNKTTEGALAIYKLSILPQRLKNIFLTQPIKEIPILLSKSPEGRVLMSKIEEFLDNFGHRGVKEFDIGLPRWKEDPSFIFQMIKNYLQLEEDEETPLEHFKKQRAERERDTDKALKRLSQSFISKVFPIKKWLFKKALKLAQFYLPQRENNKFYALKYFSASRRILLALGEIFHGRRYLKAPDEIFFLTIADLEKLAGDHFSIDEIQKTIHKRKLEWNRSHQLKPPFIVRSDGKWVNEGHRAHEAKGDPNCLKGVTASAGMVQGKARVIMDPEDGCQFNKGEILVAPFTDPGWTPLFLTAKALVMETGGIFSHGAVVAREYGIPAVVGVIGATELIKTGDNLLVDANEGKIKILS
jgi:pyruvate,water dikinase